MRSFETKLPLTSAVLGVCAVVSLGCADILGADFNRGFGGGDALTTATGATSTASASASTTSSNTGTSASGSGTGGAPACDLDPSATLSDTVVIDVWAKDTLSPWTQGQPNDGADDFFMSRAGVPLPNSTLYHNHLSTYKLYLGPDLGNRVLVYQCTDEGHYFTLEPTGGCVCMGYAVQILLASTSMLDPADYIALTRIQGSMPLKSALILDEPMPTVCDKFGAHAAGKPGCSALDKLYGAK